MQFMTACIVTYYDMDCPFSGYRLSQEALDAMCRLNVECFISPKYGLLVARVSCTVSEPYAQFLNLCTYVQYVHMNA